MKVRFLLQKIFQFIVRLILIPFFSLRYRLKIKYKVKLKHYSNGIYASNHQSLIDPPFVGVFSPKSLYFLAKKELFKNKIFGFIISLAGAIPVNRAIFSKKLLEKISIKLKNDNSILIFPEGTRSRSNEMNPPKAGVGYFTDKSNYPPIIPIKIYNSYKSLKNIKKLKYNELKLTYGRPFCINKNYDWGEGNNKYRNISKYIHEKIGEMK